MKMETQIYNYDLRFLHKLNEKNVEVLEIKNVKVEFICRLEKIP
ncbi:hypothetical protein DJ94_1607 [Bacillus pseudomycoides]|nr:hypothetical protein DJ94_1607 [Bacillus pseudomycoides]